MIVCIGQRRERLPLRLVVVRTFANHRAGRAIGVINHLELFGPMFPVPRDVAAMRPIYSVTAHRADVPILGDTREQQQRDDKQLQSAGPLREPGAR